MSFNEIENEITRILSYKEQHCFDKMVIIFNIFKEIFENVKVISGELPYNKSYFRVKINENKYHIIVHNETFDDSLPDFTIMSLKNYQRITLTQLIVKNKVNQGNLRDIKKDIMLKLEKIFLEMI
ncbi:MAG: hypothetical protein K9H48_07925 [Melioribacteraceae bacterium]|nr:hypothetical protein [Melioribacteraceae bacterium]